MKTIKEYASIYIEEYELSVTPVKYKIPLVSDWVNVTGDSILSSYYDNAWDEATGLGMLCGKASGLVCLDIDILPEDDRLAGVLSEIESRLPPLLLGRIGNPDKPPARFFKYNGEKSRKFKWIKVEILSDGNQVLMPPSSHPGGGKYTWAKSRLSEVDLDDLPTLDDDFIEWLEEVNNKYKESVKTGLSRGEKGALTDGSNRCKHGSHNFISDFALAKFYAGVTLDELTKAVLAYDNKINSDSPYKYFTCPSRKWKSNDPRTNAEFFVNQIYERQPSEHGRDKKKVESGKNGENGESGDGESSSSFTGGGASYDYFYTDDNGNKKRSDNTSDFIDFFEKMYPTARKDFFSHVVFYKDSDRKDWYPVENNLRVIRSEARDKGLMPTLVEDKLYYWFSTLKPKLLIDLPDWDGTDHIGKVLSFVTVDNISQADFESLFKAWLAGMFKRVFYPEFHNQCIIFKGKQGIGKDMFFGNIFKAINGYYSEIILSARQKDNYESIESLMVSYIPEFDESNKSSMSSLKAFISTNKATFRGAYDRKATAHVFRHSVVSSANIDNILRDPTGNRRFWIFEVNHINWKYNDVINSGQMMAQAFALFKDKYVAKPSALEAMAEYISEQTPMATEDLFIEEAHVAIKDRQDSLSSRFDVPGGKQFSDSKVRWDMISDDMSRIGRKYGLAIRTTQSILKRKGYTGRDMKSIYYAVPMNNPVH